MSNIRLAAITRIALIAIILVALCGYDTFHFIHKYLNNPNQDPSTRSISDWVYFICMGLCWVIVGAWSYLIALNVFDKYVWNKRIALLFLMLSTIPLIRNVFDDPTTKDDLAVGVLVLSCVLSFIFHKSPNKK